VVYFVEHGANVRVCANTDCGAITALHYASGGCNGDISTVKYLLEHGAMITDRTENGMTARHFSALLRVEPSRCSNICRLLRSAQA
jgi:ankyrin repeat protein